MRLDNYLVEIKLFDSRAKAKQAIERGEIYVKNNVVNKCSYSVNDINREDIEFKYTKKFVSLGGYKLDKALNDFNFSVENLTVADIGASTGGFTDCLLQRGAKKVYAVDLNDELLHGSLKTNNRVTSLIKNVKNLKKEDFLVELDLIVADLSFISITQVVGVFSKILSAGKHLIILIKPQFEIGKKTHFKNGIIKDKKIHEEICKNIIACGKLNGFEKINLTTAPINKDKNTEFLILFVKNT